MKKIYGFMGAAAAILSMASCSNEAVDGPQGGTLANADTYYMKLAISMPGGNGTRANEAFTGDDEEFDAGEDYEYTVSSVDLVLYDAIGTLVGTGTKSNPKGPTDASTNTVSHTYTDVFEITLQEDAQEPLSVVAYINATANQSNRASALTATTPADVDDIASKENGFIMTNSGYYNGTEFQIATPIVEGSYTNEATSLEDAKSKLTKKTDIYVERLAAKITLNDAHSSDNLTYRIEDPQGNPVMLDFEALKWTATGSPKTMFMFKNMPSDWQWISGNQPTWANGSSNFRSYWAKGTEYETTYDAITANLKFASYDDVVNNGQDFEEDNVEYLKEHTIDTGSFTTDWNPAAAVTSVLVYGKYTVDDDTDGKYENGFYLLFSHVDNDQKVYIIYDEKEFTKYLFDYNVTYKKEFAKDASGSEKIESFDEEIFKVEYNKEDGKFYLAVQEGQNAFVKNDEGSFEALDKDNTVPSNARHYLEGETYFFAPIAHYFGVEKGETGYYGVVRNHSYAMTITAINNLGAPMDEKYKGGEDEEEEEIVPDPKVTKEAYIDVTLNVLKWHNVEQEVEL